MVIKNLNDFFKWIKYLDDKEIYKSRELISEINLNKLMFLINFMLKINGTKVVSSNSKDRIHFISANGQKNVLSMKIKNNTIYISFPYDHDMTIMIPFRGYVRRLGNTETERLNSVFEHHFNNLEFIYDEILNHSSLLNITSSYVHKHLDKYDKKRINALCTDIKKLIWLV